MLISREREKTIKFRTAIESVESGETSLVAPHSAMYTPWTDEEKHGFVRLMTSIKREKGSRQ
jgi:hypothetical protein